MAFNLADLFEHVADRVPDRLALIVRDEHLTFEALDTRANQVAHRLRSLGVGTRFSDHGVGDAESRRIVADALDGARGRNFIGKSAASA